MKTTFIVFFILAFIPPLVSQEYLPRYFTMGADTLPYRILYPQGYEKSKKDYPLVLFLHGAGERGADNKKQLVHGSRLFADSIGQYPAIVVFPQCPENAYWATLEWERPSSVIEFPLYEKPGKPMEMVIGLLDSLLVSERVDTGRVYLAGLSMGGFGTFELLARRPQTFAAAVPICGGGNSLLAPLYAPNTHLWIFHGAADDIVPVELSQKMYRALQHSGAAVRYTEYPDANHNSWDPAFAEPRFLSWLFSQ
jgi:predicted peptidase